MAQRHPTGERLQRIDCDVQPTEGANRSLRTPLGVLAGPVNLSGKADSGGSLRRVPFGAHLNIELPLPALTWRLHVRSRT